MRKIFLRSASIVAAACILAAALPAYVEAYETADHQEISAAADQSDGGITVVIIFNDDGTYEQTVYSNLSSVSVPAATADGELEWAIFHLGFKDWNDDTGDLYFTVSADEPMWKISGTAYVRSTSILFPSYYYNDPFSENLYSSYNSSRILATDIDTEDETEVRVGFKNVILYTIAGDTATFSNASQIVSR